MTGERPGRFWYYSYKRWSPRWWQWVLPMFSSDEYGRRTIVQHVPPFGFLAVAYWTCKCEFCDQARAEMEEYAREPDAEEEASAS